VIFIYKYKLKLRSIYNSNINIKNFDKSNNKINFNLELPENIKNWCVVYEKLLRVLYSECKIWDKNIYLINGYIYLNGIDIYSSKLIKNFINNPSDMRLKNLYKKIRLHKGLPEIMTIIACRNLSIEYEYICSEYEIERAYVEILNIKLNHTLNIQEIPKLEININKRILKLLFKKPIFIRGQESPLVPSSVINLIKNKIYVYKLLKFLKHNVPYFKEISSKKQLLTFDKGKSYILKPIYGSHKVGIIGPVKTKSKLINAYSRCLHQGFKNQSAIICQEYKLGKHIRVNINNNKITFVAQSIRKKITGDGKSKIIDMINKTENCLDKKRIKNILIGEGMNFNTILPKNRNLLLSLDGNGGTFIDITKSLKNIYKKEMLRISKELEIPVLGIDAIIDTNNKLWIIDIESNPDIDYFVNTNKAYETMKHSIKTYINNFGR
jgi:hypothetical protein